MTYDARARRKKVDGEYRRRYDLAKLRGIPTAPLPAKRTADKIRALYDLGWSYEAISHMAGTSDTALLLIVNDTSRVVHRATAQALDNIPITLAPTPAVPDTCLIPTLGATRRIQALMRLGWTHTAMHDAYGFHTTQLSRGTYKQTLASKVRAVAAMYDDLCMTLGPSTKTATYARNARMHPPLAWRDIDDPTENPRLTYGQGDTFELVDRAVVDKLLAGERVPSTKAEKVEAMRLWLAWGRSEASLCRIHGWKDGRYKPADEEGAA